MCGNFGLDLERDEGEGEKKPHRNIELWGEVVCGFADEEKIPKK